MSLSELLSNPFIQGSLAFFSVVLFWVGWAFSYKPRCSPGTPEDIYIDDSTYKKVETINFDINWGTRLFWFNNCTVLEIPASSIFLIKYTPLGGAEEELPNENYTSCTSKNPSLRIIKIKQKSFFKQNSINKIKVLIQTPFERSSYEKNVKHEYIDNTLYMWNEGSEEIRNFKFLLTQSVKIRNLHIIDGKISSFEIDIAYHALSSVLEKQIGDIETDVSKILILNLPPRGTKSSKSFIMRLH
jgi:hypothetical protein